MRSVNGPSVGKLWREESQSMVINILNPPYLDTTPENRHTYHVETSTQQLHWSDLLHLDNSYIQWWDPVWA